MQWSGSGVQRQKYGMHASGVQSGAVTAVAVQLAVQCALHRSARHCAARASRPIRWRAPEAAASSGAASTNSSVCNSASAQAIIAGACAKRPRPAGTRDRASADTGALEAVVDAIIAANPDQVEQFRAGKDKVLGFFVGQVMKATQGKANPGQVNQLLRDKLAG